MSLMVSERSILDAIGKYQDNLKSFSEEEFCRKPHDGGWSCSEVYCHMLQVNMRCLLAVERCIHGKKQPRRSGPSFISHLILYFGRFPPGKLKAPPNVASIVKTITLEDAKNDLIKFTGKLKELMPKALKCSPYQRIKHQRLGMLNAIEWLRFLEIHTKHHLKQLKRIRSSFR